jgi:hypothetical protein
MDRRFRAPARARDCGSTGNMIDAKLIC